MVRGHLQKANEETERNAARNAARNAERKTTQYK
jgi:hypothetical protein